MAERGIVTIQKLGGKGRGRTRSLTVPAEIAQHVPDGSQFRVELTENGILYVPVKVPGMGVRAIPEWTRGVKP